MKKSPPVIIGGNTIFDEMFSLQNIEDWQLSGSDGEHCNDGIEDMSQKYHSLTETAAKDTDAETVTVKENGHHFNGVNGNGIHEDHDDSEDDDCNGAKNEDSARDTGHEAETTSTDTIENEPIAPVPYYGRTLVAPEYMNFQLQDDNSQKEEKDMEGDASGQLDQSFGGEEDKTLSEDEADKNADDDQDDKSKGDERDSDEEQITREEEELEASPNLAQPEEDGEQKDEDEGEEEKNEEDEVQEKNEMGEEDEKVIDGDGVGIDEHSDDIGVNEIEEEDGVETNNEGDRVVEDKKEDGDVVNESEEGAEEEESSEEEEVEQEDENARRDETERYEDGGGESDEVEEETKEEKKENDIVEQRNEDVTDHHTEETSEQNNGIERENEEEKIEEKETPEEEAEFDGKQSVDDDLTLEVQNESFSQPPKAEDEDDIQDEEFDNEDLTTGKESTLEHYDSLKVNVSSPTPDLTEVGSAESLHEVEIEQKEDDDGDEGEDQEEAAAEREESSKETDEHEEQPGVTVRTVNYWHEIWLRLCYNGINAPIHSFHNSFLELRFKAIFGFFLIVKGAVKR